MYLLVLMMRLSDNGLMASQTLDKTKIRNQLILLGIGALALYIVIPQIGGFQDSFTIVKGANLVYIAAAIGFSFLTFMIAACTYCILALKPLRYWRTVLAEMAAMFVNRLLPAGIGGMGANYVYLRKAKHTLPQAASVVTANNLIGLTGHILLTVVLLVVFRDQLPALPTDNLQRNAGFIAAAAVFFILIIFFARTLKGRVLAKIAAIAAQLIAYSHHPHKLFAALGTSSLLTLCNVVCLWFCVQSLGVDLGLVPVMLIFTLGVAIGVATPTPGGLGGVEAGLIAGLIAYGVPSSMALAIALTYRFINYWLSLAVGAGAFVICRHKKIL